MKTLMSYLVITALILMSSFTINSQQKINEAGAKASVNTFKKERQVKNALAINASNHK